jgi:hypothetical protein
VAGCGGGERQDAHEPSGNFDVRVTQASFPPRQSLSQRQKMVIQVHNADQKTIPNVAVTLTTILPHGGQGGKAADLGTSVKAFATLSPQCPKPPLTNGCPGLADPSRPVWIVDAGPHNGTTAYSNTWALGPLPAGQTKTFIWRVVPVQAGAYTVKAQIAAGLNGKAHAVAPGSTTLLAPTLLPVVISGKPAQATVNDQGQVVTEPSK